MTTKIITYRDWTFEVDFDRTIQVYKSMDSGSPELCSCNDCKNFVENREAIYPSEIKDLLSYLGIDYRKEMEISHFCKLENGLHHYGGWFHFKGAIIKGKDCKINLPNGGSTFDTVHVTKDFQIAFMKDNSLHIFDQNEKNELIQIEFLANSEWIIDKELESE